MITGDTGSLDYRSYIYIYMYLFIGYLDPWGFGVVGCNSCRVLVCVGGLGGDLILQQMWNIASRLMVTIEALKYGRPRPGIAVYAVLPWTLITESPAFWLKI